MTARSRTLTGLALAGLAAACVLATAQAGAGPLEEPAAKASAAPRPQIAKRLIPYGPDRQNDMAQYSRRHYGEAVSELTDPKLIVIHYAEAGSISSIFNTFAPNRPDVEYNELPGVCSHYAVGSSGAIVRFVPDSIRCRHVVGLNHVSLGIEHVGFSDGDVLNNKRELKASLRLTQFLRCREGLGIKQVIGHNESLKSPYYLELDPDFKGRTHGDFPTRAMRVYRKALRKLGSC
jgi:N-acetylmuramoyl-L-alanine amidase